MYANHGDRNFFESGLLMDAHGADDVRFILCEPLYDDFGDDEMRYFFAAGAVDCTAEWMDVEDIAHFVGLDTVMEVTDFARACIDYYGAEEFSCDWDTHILTRAEVEAVVKRYYWSVIDKSTVVFE